MNQEQRTIEMVEFNKAVERLWATYDRVQYQYCRDEHTDTREFDLNRRYDKVK
jgi:hypothetical protein